MGRLSVYLPPFAGDYSGACAALFDFNCLIILCDAACCTKNYVDYDEPRWSRRKTTTLCAQLRTLEVTLGDDERLLRQAAEAALDRRPDFVALLGSPVPAIVGMDMGGMARELEARTGIPAIGLDTTGFDTYQRGVELAMGAVYRRFAEKNRLRRAGTVNLLGLTPLDFGADGNAAALREAVEQTGFTVGGSLMMDCTLDQVRRTAEAEVNLVLSAPGMSLARELERELGTPYVAFVPTGTWGVERLGELLHAAAAAGRSMLPEPAPAEEGGDGILLVGDQVLTSSLRLALREAGCVRPVSAGSFFSRDPGLTRSGDLFLSGELDLVQALRGGRFSAVVGDPLLARVPECRQLSLHPLPHPAVSSRLHWDEVPILTGGVLDALLRDLIK